MSKASRTAARTVSRRGVLAGGAAAFLAAGKAPVYAQATPKKLVFAHINPLPESAAIAFDCGFGDLSTFNTTFRARFGISPTGYRRQATRG